MPDTARCQHWQGSVSLASDNEAGPECEVLVEVC